MAIEIEKEIRVMHTTPDSEIFLSARIDPDVQHHNNTDAVYFKQDIPSAYYSINDLKAMRSFITKAIQQWQRN